MRRSYKGLGQDKLMDLNFLVAEFLEKKRSELGAEMKQKPQKAKQIYERLSRILFSNHPIPGVDLDKEVAEGVNLKGLVLLYHDWLKQTWDVIKRTIFSYNERMESAAYDLAGLGERVRDIQKLFMGFVSSFSHSQNPDWRKLEELVEGFSSAIYELNRLLPALPQEAGELVEFAREQFTSGLQDLTRILPMLNELIRSMHAFPPELGESNPILEQAAAILREAPQWERIQSPFDEVRTLVPALPQELRKSVELIFEQGDSIFQQHPRMERLKSEINELLSAPPSKARALAGRIFEQLTSISRESGRAIDEIYELMGSEPADPPKAATSVEGVGDFKDLSSILREIHAKFFLEQEEQLFMPAVSRVDKKDAKIPMVRLHFEKYRIKFSDWHDPIKALLEILDGLPTDIFRKCPKCGRCFIETRKGKEYCNRQHAVEAKKEAKKKKKESDAGETSQ